MPYILGYVCYRPFEGVGPSKSVDLILGKRELVCMLLVYPIVYRARVSFCLVSLSFGISDCQQFGPQTQWRPLLKAFTSELGSEAMSFAWSAVVQLVVFFSCGLQNLKD